MTGPVERVPLTDEQPRIDLAAVRRDVSRANDPAVAGEGRRVVEGRVRYAASVLIDEVERLSAELRASRAGEQEAADAAVAAIRLMNQAGSERDALRQRIDKALEVLDSSDGAAVAENTDEGTRFAAAVRAALTGTET